MKTVRLWESVGLGIVIDYPTGVLYTTQAGGTLCRQPSLEGIFVPIGNDVRDDGQLVSPAVDLYDYFAGPPHYGEGAVGGIDDKDAMFIDAVLRKYHVPGVIAVDRSRLVESQEAWVFLTVSGEEDTRDEFRLFSGFGPYPRSAVLTWSNSD